MGPGFIAANNGDTVASARNQMIHGHAPGVHIVTRNKYAEKAVSQAKSEETAAKEKQEKTTSEVKLAEDISDKSAKVIEQDELRKKRYLEIAAMQLQAWESGAGWIYWSYQFKPNRKEPLDEKWKESWDFSRCVENGWIEFKNR